MSSGGYGIEGGVDFTQQGVRLPRAIFNVVTPGYFETLRVPIRRGRNFDERDRRGATMTVIVNESFVRQSFKDRDPIGQRIQCGFDTLEFMTIVGVVADMRSDSPGTPPQPEIWMPYEQHPRGATGLNIVMRVRTADPLALAETVRRRIAAINPDVPVRATTMDGTLTSASATPRFRTFLIGVFAGLALLLALAGIYGVMTYTVSQRVPELGVRIALGATPGHIMRLIIGQGAALAAIGLVLGIVLALVSGRWLEGMLFGVTARDPWILATVTVGVAFATLLACYIPGRRAVRVDPMVALRAE
jgi:predicted permease